MLDQIMDLVKQHAGDAIINNQAIPNQHNDAAIADVSNQIFSGLQNQISQGNFQQVTSLFQGGSIANNPMVTQIISSVAGSLASKFGVSPQSAQSIASSLIPTVMNKFISKTNDPSDSSFNLQDVMSGLGGSNFDIGGMLGQLGGNSKQDSGLGDIGGMLGGLFK
ncbi:MAG TPA: DUF937 domain-containing protein [Cyclobacteriaceae bacterium]|nr:DUF937 domain-containing protein [Cyclobacteriaceae bacterium]